MENAPDMASGYTASQAARLLGMGRHEVARLVRNGILRARKTDSGALAIDPGSVHAHGALSQFKGRPWSPQTAWAALLAIGGDDVSWLEYHKRRRLLLKLREIGAGELIWLARNRMEARRYLVSRRSKTTCGGHSWPRGWPRSSQATSDSRRRSPSWTGMWSG